MLMIALQGQEIGPEGLEPFICELEINFRIWWIIVFDWQSRMINLLPPIVYCVFLSICLKSLKRKYLDSFFKWNMPCVFTDFCAFNSGYLGLCKNLPKKN